ncbi:MAG: hypothetical protein WC736_14135 [Gallionella sp.]|jgi:hypothetical protein
MSKTCIICGGPAGSGEHVFPASLGGRRTNKGIYCKTHDNGYGSLVGGLAEQMAFFNSRLGVILDHSKEVKSIITTDEHSGQKVRLSVLGSDFIEPRVILESPLPKGKQVQMAFPDEESIKKWIEEQKAAGMDVAILEKGQKQNYFLDTNHFRLNLGGPFGLAAVAYVAQTFLAQAFPDVARSSALADFKKYTQDLAVKAQKMEDELSAWQADTPVWWSFEQPEDENPNAFDFGHRVTVGIDSSDGLIYGRISFFSTLHFAMIFGVTTDPVVTKTVTIDIDPLAEHPPNDIKRTEHQKAIARVSRPASQTAELANAINSGTGEKIVSDLVRRLIDHGLKRTAEEMHAELGKAASLAPEERKAFFSRVLEVRSQRVWNVMQYVTEGLLASQGAKLLPHSISQKFKDMVAYNPTSSNGLSQEATNSFEFAHKALLEQMLKDDDNGILDVRRLSALMGEGLGAGLIGEAIFKHVIDSFKQ